MNEHPKGEQDGAQPDAHETARRLTEDALDAYVEGDKKKGDQLVDRAQQTDSSAVEEVMQDLDADAQSDHSVPTSDR